MTVKEALENGYRVYLGKSKYSVHQLPSGFWAVFQDDHWIDASSKTKEDALRLLRSIQAKNKANCVTI